MDIKKIFTVVERMGVDQTEIPVEMKSAECFVEKSTQFEYQCGSDILPVSYENLKSGKKNYALSTMYSAVKITTDERNKPNIPTFYNLTKCEADFLELISSPQTIRFDSKI